MTIEVKIDGIPYIVKDQESFTRLKEDIKTNKDGIGDEHQASLDAIRDELLESIPEEDKKRIEQENERTGALQALVAGLSNDESAKATYLANKRFPNLKSERGIEPSDLYFIDKDEDLKAIADSTAGEPQRSSRLPLPIPGIDLDHSLRQSLGSHEASFFRFFKTT